MIVYLHASGLIDSGRTFGRHRGLDVRHAVVPEATPVGEIADFVLERFTDVERAAPNGTIEQLVINSHGGPGAIHMGGIEDDAYDINAYNAAEFAAPFQPLLKQPEQGGQGVEIHGCGIAGGSLVAGTSNTDDGELGFRFIYALARGFGRRVRASASPQVSDSEGMFEDTLIQAVPDDEADWHGHVSLLNGTGILHDGGFLTRARATFDAFFPGDPRDGRAAASRTAAPHPSWSRE